MVRAGGGAVSQYAFYLVLPAEVIFCQRSEAVFFQAMEELKSSSVVIDRDTLELIRVFQNEGNQ